MDEMEHQEGKRVLHEKKQSPRAKIAILVGAAVVALLVGGYIGLCAFLNGGTTILPNTTAAGVELGGLRLEEAQEKLEQETAARFAAHNVSFQDPDGNTAEVKGRSVEIDTTEVARQAALLGREGGFFGGGIAYIKALVGGTDIAAPIRFSTEGERGVDEMLAAMEDRLTQKVEQTSYKLEENTLALIKGVSGMSVNVTDIKANILDAFATGKDGGPAFTIQSEIAPPDAPDFDAIYQAVFTQATDAYLDKATKQIIPSVTGVSFDIATAQAMLERTDEGAVCKVPLSKSEPTMTTEKLTANLFKDVLGSTKTYASGPSQRWYNIKLACSFINNTILLPDEVFSYNGACEPYTQGNGYQNAGTYQNGKSVDATAGGICQLSSTLYWATLEANLATVERSKHAFNGGYMPIVGTDATVFSGAPDFKFKNDTAYPVKIESYMDDNHNVYVVIYGTSTGLRGEPFNKVISTVSAQTVYKPDASIPAGSAPRKDPEQYALSGITVEVYLRVVNTNGDTVETRFLHKNTYAKRDGVYRYNPADAARLGIDPATGLKNLTPVAPAPSETPLPSTDPAITPDPAVTPSPEGSQSPSPSQSVAPEVTTPPTVAPSPSETVPPVPSASVVPSEAPPPGIPLDPPVESNTAPAA